MKTFLSFFFSLLFLAACQPSLHYEDTGRALEYKSGEKTLFAYNYATVYPPAGVDTVYKRSGFFHPVNDMAGETLTNLSPSDHYHHYGLWYAWTKTTFEGDEIDFWNVYKKQGTVRFREFTEISDTGFSAVLDHIVYPDSSAEKTAMIENLEIRIGKPDGAAYYLDYITTVQCATTSPITLEQYRYGGLVIRTRADWTPDRTAFLTSEGYTRENADNTNARWALFGGKTDKGDACILILSHPSNLNYPEPLRIWDEKANAGTGDMMWNFSPTKKYPHTLDPSDELRLHYRIFVFDNPIHADRAERLWQRFTEEYPEYINYTF
ncbi:PmoA family protein [Dysgonomonas sp. 25]|uniref:DUF6807 domain-containing protein n=1 Tax=Dysgonomonas sp. 25 TaxID=2302933 RepID=UPI0013D36E40|nr:PmoA family protein [Dysgonomonas sp. 25]NDV70074.1 hypothetical protein [Dysgonomonas sp. 25]